MSTDPTGLGEKPFEPINYINLQLTREDWCSYKGYCKVGQLLTNKHDIACILCTYRRPLNIPARIEELEEDGKKCKE